MMRRFLAFSACALVIAACSDRAENSPTQAQPDGSISSELDQTIAEWIATCVAQGSTQANCACRANTTARIMSPDDFAEETDLLRSGNQSDIDAFQRRMFAEQRETMFRLGQALSECPTMWIETE